MYFCMAPLSDTLPETFLKNCFCQSLATYIFIIYTSHESSVTTQGWVSYNTFTSHSGFEELRALRIVWSKWSYANTVSRGFCKICLKFLTDPV